MNNKASITALMSAFCRAYHLKHSDKPVFSDTFAEKLMTKDEYKTIEAYIKGGIDFFAPEKKDSFKDDAEAVKWIVETQLAPTPLARARFCEDCLKTAVMTGTSQYVILGAGMDTFALRENELMKKLTVFEADHPKTQEDKLSRIGRAEIDVPENLKFVAVDFTKDNLKDRLLANGYDVKKKTFFSWLGVSYYLAEKDVNALIESISSFAAEGSTLVFDCADENLFNSEIKRVRNMLAMAAAGGEPMKFGANMFDLEIMLDRGNFRVYELLTPEDIQLRYFGERNDNLTAFEHISYVLAVLKGAPPNGTRENILKTSLRLFAKRGYDAVSVRDIAGELGITQAALYKHYKNKRAIFDAILDRMKNEDYRRAAKYGVPEGTASEMKEKYEATPFSDIKNFTLMQFRYWTRDEYAADFRRMITIEQYKDEEMSKIYHDYLAGGVVDYVSDLFNEMIKRNILKNADPKRLALEFYAPIYMLINLYDKSENKAKIEQMTEACLDSFEQNYCRGN